MVAPLEYDQSKFIKLDVNDAVYSFYPPISGKRFVITGIRASAAKSVGTSTDAVVIIYESGAAESSTQDKVLHHEEMIKGESVTMTGMNLLTTEGFFINATSTLTDISMTIFGYYVSA